MKKLYLIIWLIICLIQPSEAVISSAAHSVDEEGQIKPMSGKAIATSTGGNVDVLGLWFINSGQVIDDDVIVFRLLFNNYLYDSSGDIGVSERDIFSESVEAKFESAPLFYPNPWKMSEGSTLGYTLSKNMTVNLQIYNMMGRRIYNQTYEEATNGGLQGINNKISFDASTFGGYELSAGVYFYALIHEGEVLAKGKFAVIP